AAAVAAAVLVGGSSGDRPSPRGARAGYFPNVALTTHDGRAVRFYDDIMKGDKIVLVNFMYAHCTGVCPGSTRNLVRVQRLLQDRIGRDVFMYSITLDPARDTPQALAEYARSYRTGPGWTFLTGAKADIEAIRHAVGFVDPDSTLDADRTNHSGLVLIGNEAIDRYMAEPAGIEPARIVDAVTWMESPRMRA